MTYAYHTTWYLDSRQNSRCSQHLRSSGCRSRSRSGGVMRGVMMFAKFNAVAALVLASMLVSVPVRAQVSGATLSGTVTDRSDTGVPNVTVSIKNTATGIAREVATDTAGFYSVPNLTPGVYEVSFSAAG